MSVHFSPATLDAIAEAIADRVAMRLGSMPKGDDLIDVNEAAELLGCSVSTLGRATKREITTVRVGRLVRYRRADLLNRHAGAGLSSSGQHARK